MKEKKEIQDLLNVFLMNIITIAVSLFNGFFIPKFIPVDAYAVYRMFLLYTGYVGFLHFGFINGTYLKYGSYNYEELPLYHFRGLNKFYFFMQGIITIGGIALCLFLNTSYKSVFLFVSINIFFININYYISQINQFTCRFYTERKIYNCKNFLLLIGSAAVFFMKTKQQTFLLTLQTIINIIVFVLLIKNNKEIIFGKAEKVRCLLSEIKGIFKSGFFIMLSEFVSIFIFGFDSMLVNKQFSLHNFAMYSFAVSVLTLVFNLINSVSNLIFPYLSRADKLKLGKYFSLLFNCIIAVSTISLSGFFIIKMFILEFLDGYRNSIFILEIIFPTIIFRAIISLLFSNFYKVLKSAYQFAFNNFMALILGIALDIIFYLKFRSAVSIAYASLLTFMIWFLITFYYFAKMFHIKKSEMVSKIVLIGSSITIFFLAEKVNGLGAFFVYFIFTAAFNVIVFRRDLKNSWKYLKKNTYK